MVDNALKPLEIYSGMSLEGASQNEVDEVIRHVCKQFDVPKYLYNESDIPKYIYNETQFNKHWNCIDRRLSSKRSNESNRIS